MRWPRRGQRWSNGAQEAPVTVGRSLIFRLVDVVCSGPISDLVGREFPNVLAVSGCPVGGDLFLRLLQIQPPADHQPVQPVLQRILGYRAEIFAVNVQAQWLRPKILNRVRATERHANEVVHLVVTTLFPSDAVL